MLEPDEGKLSSPVLRGLSGRKAARLSGEARNWFAPANPDRLGMISNQEGTVTVVSASLPAICC